MPPAGKRLPPPFKIKLQPKRLRATIALFANFIIFILLYRIFAITQIYNDHHLTVQINHHRQRQQQPPTATTIRLLLAGDLILGRGVDQILPHPGNYTLTCGSKIKPWMKCNTDARNYQKITELLEGPLPFQRGPEYPWGVALQDMDEENPHARIFNLETVVSDVGEEWPDKQFHIRMSAGNVDTLKAPKPTLYTHANNHALDYSIEGLEGTLEILQSNGLPVAGVGLNRVEAEAPFIITLPPTTTSNNAADTSTSTSTAGRILVWAMAEPGSGLRAAFQATDRQPGIFQRSLTDSTITEFSEMVQQYKQPGDVVVLAIHWGENYQLAPPNLHAEFAHKLIDEAGVDVVAGASSHHIMGGEVYNDKLILYGMGDLITDGTKGSICSGHFMRKHIGALWYVDIDSTTGKLQRMRVKPTSLYKMSVAWPDQDDFEYAFQILSGNFSASCAAAGTSCTLIEKAVTGKQREMELTWAKGTGVVRKLRDPEPTHAEDFAEINAYCKHNWTVITV